MVFCRDKGRSMAIRISYKPSGLCTNLYNENNNNKFQRRISQSLLQYNDITLPDSVALA